MVRPLNSVRMPPAYTNAAEPIPAMVPNTGMKLENTTS